MTIVDRRCSIHPQREAVVRCPQCHRFFCRECVTEHAGRMICGTCVAQLARVAGASSRARQALWITLGLGGFLITWLIFYYLGMTLARMPSEFHGGPA